MQEKYEGSDENKGHACRNLSSVTGSGLTASRWTHWDYRLKEFHSCLCSSQFVCSSAHVLPILPLLNCNDTNCGISKFVSRGKMRYTVVLIIGQLNIILDPDNSRWWVCFNVTLQIHVILQCLSEPWSWSRYHRRKLDFNSNVPSCTFAHPIFSHTVVRSPVLLVNPCYLQNIPSVN